MPSKPATATNVFVAACLIATLCACSNTSAQRPGNGESPAAPWSRLHQVRKRPVESPIRVSMNSVGSRLQRSIRVFCGLITTPVIPPGSSLLMR